MNGIFPCGGHIHERNHEVKTVRGLDEYEVSCKLPAAIEISECRACGRNRLRIFDADGNVVKDRG